MLISYQRSGNSRRWQRFRMSIFAIWGEKNMCPEMNERKDISVQKNKLIFVCVFAAFVIVALGVEGCLHYPFPLW